MNFLHSNIFIGEEAGEQVEKALNKQTVEKEVSSFQRFIYWVLIPLLFALFLSLLIASIAGVNVFQKAKELGEKVPILSGVIAQEEKQGLEEYEAKIISLDAEIQNKNAQIDQLKKQLENKEIEKERYIQKQKSLEVTIDELKQMRDEEKRALKDIVSTYEAMSPKKSAPIILEMKDEEALKILSNLGSQSLAKILENMPPKDAAKYMEQLSTN